MGEEYWVRGPSVGIRIKKDFEGKYDRTALRGLRWRLIARPALSLWGLLAGKRISDRVGILIQAGQRVLTAVEWAAHDGAEHPESKAAYEERISDLNRKIAQLEAKYQEALDGERRGRNLVSAIRAADVLLDDERAGGATGRASEARP